VEETEVRRKKLRERLIAGELEDTIIEVSVEDKTPPMLEVFSGAGGGGNGHKHARPLWRGFSGEDQA